jgi:hypothetical protein
MSSRIFDIPIFYLAPDNFPRALDRLHYNHAIGYAWLEPRKRGIRVEYCFARERPSRFLVKRTFEDRGKLFQITCDGLSNMEIFSRLLEGFNECQKFGDLHKFWIDTGSLHDFGRYVDWKALVAGSAAIESRMSVST